MPYRPEAELKRPDLKGEFLCGHCGKTFCHAASLNRHRLNFHGDDQQCLLCMSQIEANDTVRRHMQVKHDIPRVFTCGCCNWTFPDKKELHSHNNSMLKTGEPGEAQAIAISSRPPGSLSQHELRGEERTPKQKKTKSAPSTSTKSPRSTKSSKNAVTDMTGLFGAASLSAPSTSTAPVAPPGIPEGWFNHLVATNPTLMTFMQQQLQLHLANMQMNALGAAAVLTVKTSASENEDAESVAAAISSSSSASSPASSSSEEVSTTSRASTNNNNAAIISDAKAAEAEEDHFFQSKLFVLSVKTATPDTSTCSGPESGICSDGLSLSPCSSEFRSKEGSPGSEEAAGKGLSKVVGGGGGNPLNVENLLSTSPLAKKPTSSASSPSSNRKRKSVDMIAASLYKKQFKK